ncbi:MAG: hypothetical protein QHH07_01230 [Sedimentisphaerales bacterium]|nr:hypothetical protein [Sedimentisphaerales bacterium]
MSTTHKPCSVLAVLLISLMAQTGQAKWPWQSDRWPWNRLLKPKPAVLYIADPARDSKRAFTRQSSELYAIIRKMTTAQAGPGLVIVVPGWKGKGDWYKTLAVNIKDTIDKDGWLCGWYDWRDQANRLGHTEATQAARITFGPSLGAEVVALSHQWRHVHLIGLDSGCWLISEAAKVISAHTNASIHLTFLEPYCPPFWRQEELGQLDCNDCWADHYFSREIPTHQPFVLPHAHNVDLTTIEPGPAPLPFACRWYLATVSGRYLEQRYRDRPVFTTVGQIAYGFVRSLEAGKDNWAYSLKLKVGNEPVLVIGK